MEKFYPGVYHTPQLQREIRAAFPEWRGQPNPLYPGGWEPDFTLFPLPEGVHISCPAVDPARLDAVFQAHDPRRLTPAEQARLSASALAARCAGRAISALTLDDVRGLLAWLVFRAGGLDEATQKVRPPEEWGQA